MFSKARKRAPLLIATMLLASNCAGGPAERPTTANPPPDSPRAYCAAFQTISHADLPKGQTDDPGNVADSPITVAQVLAHNAVWFALCTDPLAPPG